MRVVALLSALMLRFQLVRDEAGFVQEKVVEWKASYGRQ